MTVYDELVIVDEYEDTHGNQTAILRACNVMVAYLCASRLPLSYPVVHAARVANAYIVGSAGVNELQTASNQVTQFLQELQSDSESPQDTLSVVRACGALMKLLQKPAWGGGASEALSNFLEWMDHFEVNHPLFEQLLVKAFGSSNH